MPKKAESAGKTESQINAEASFIYHKYAAQLLAFTNKRLSQTLRKRVESEDILQSVFKSFFTRYQDKIENFSPNELWKLLVTVTLNKIRRKRRFHSAEKRDWQSEQESNSYNTQLEFVDHRELSASDLVAISDELAWLNRQLKQEQRTCLELRLQGWDVPEIAKKLDTTDRTIRRWLNGIKNLLEFHENKRQDTLYTKRNSPQKLEWPPNLTIFDYRDFVIKQMLGVGSMCKVYRALNITTQENVCIKILRQEWRDRYDFQQQFLNEAIVLRSLSHPSIVPVIGAGQMPGGALFLILKWINGQSLNQVLREAKVSSAFIDNLIDQVRKSLSEIHKLGLTHGDLHAGNILVDEQNKTWLTDFSFARLEKKSIPHLERIQEDWRAFEQLKNAAKFNNREDG